MPDYKQMLKEAEDREAGVKKVFQQYDIDGGGSIDPAEITCVMEDLGLLSGLKTDVTSFVASAFARYDENDDGALSFEEFKKFYNAAKDDAQGRKPPPAKPSGGGKTSGLDSSTNDARQRLKEEKARKKAEEAEKIRAENAAMKARMKEKSKAGGDSKALDADLLAARKEAADKRKAEKEAAAAKMAAENKAQKAKLKNTGARTDNDLLDDVAADGTSVADARNKKAQDGQDAKAARAKDASDRAGALKNMKNNTASRTDNDLLDDVDADGNSVADARNKKAQDGADAKAKRAKDMKDEAAELARMKRETGSKTDHDLLDDVDADGNSVAQARDQKAQDGKDAKAKRSKDMKDEAAELARQTLAPTMTPTRALNTQPRPQT
eukprot:scaffold14224_cov62-Phaeocystis_antarctica.AAC.2